MSDVTVRREVKDDLQAIDRVNREVFGTGEEALMVRTVRESGEPMISLVAIANGNVVGHVLFSRATISSDGREWPAVALAPMGVLPEYQGRRIGSKLVERGLQECRDGGYERAIVLGHPSFTATTRGSGSDQRRSGTFAGNTPRRLRRSWRWRWFRARWKSARASLDINLRSIQQRTATRVGPDRRAHCVDLGA